MTETKAIELSSILEEGKWVKIRGWAGPDAGKQEIVEGIANYKQVQAAKD